VRPYPTTCTLQASQKIVVIGDVQRTSLLEYSLLGRELNDREQILLLRDVKARPFDAVVLLGDMAFDGSDDAWAHFDALMEPLRTPTGGAGSAESSETMFFPVMGNHDYSAGSEEQIRRRFSAFGGARRGSFMWGNVRMIVLDGNRDHLCLRPFGCQPEWQAQLRWLQEQLDSVDKSTCERGAILFVHQSPYTQSPLVGDDQDDARAFAQKLLNSRRGLALLSAHAHGFESYHFKASAEDQRPAKYFIVSAGGGGPRPPERRKGALCDDSELPWPRPFNYLRLTQTSSGVQMDVRGIDTDDSAAHDLPLEQRTFYFN
jgi:hypothetical protein